MMIPNPNPVHLEIKKPPQIISNYKCIRCGYETPNKTHIKGHVNRKNVCQAILQDIDPKEFLDEILTSITSTTDKRICQYCEKKFSRTDSKNRHEKSCKITES